MIPKELREVHVANFHLLSTRRNLDGSFETPSVDEVIVASDNVAAIARARRFPIGRFDGASDFVWLVDPEGVVLWSQDLTMPEAA